MQLLINYLGIYGRDHRYKWVWALRFHDNWHQAAIRNARVPVVSVFPALLIGHGVRKKGHQRDSGGWIMSMNWQREPPQQYYFKKAISYWSSHSLVHFLYSRFIIEARFGFDLRFWSSESIGLTLVFALLLTNAWASPMRDRQLVGVLLHLVRREEACPRPRSTLDDEQEWFVWFVYGSSLSWVTLEGNLPKFELRSGVPDWPVSLGLPHRKVNFEKFFFSPGRLTDVFP